MEKNNVSATTSSTYDDASEKATNILENLQTKKKNDKEKDGGDKKEEEKTLSEEEEDDQFEEDLYTAINYNTINSLAALKEILGTGDTENIVDSSWFQYHFLRHVNRLPSRSNYASAWSPWEGNRRRLSECKEEDEDAEDKEEEKKKTEVKPETNDGKFQPLSPTPPQTPKTPPTSATPKTPSTPSSRPTTPTGFAPPLRRRFASVGNVGRESPGPLVSGLPQYGSMEPVGNWHSTSRTSPLPSPHLDKRFFDCSLIEMKSQASSSSTLDYDSMDEVWVKRNDVSITPEIIRRKKELGSQPLPVIAVEDHMTTGGEPQMRPRAGTWSMPSRSRRQKTSSTSSQPDSNSSSGRATPTPTSGRRKSGDDILTNVSPSRKAQTLFDAFRPRSKSDASKAKKPSNIISQMKSAMHRASGSSQSSQSRSSSIDGSSEEREKDKHHGRPRAGSETKDRTRTMSDGKEKHPQRPRAGSDSGKGTVSKVMDLFRYRSHSAVSAEDKRKAEEQAGVDPRIVRRKPSRSSSTDEESQARKQYKSNSSRAGDLNQFYNSFTASFDSGNLHGDSFDMARQLSQESDQTVENPTGAVELSAEKAEEFEEEQEGQGSSITGRMLNSLRRSLSDMRLTSALGKRSYNLRTGVSSVSTPVSVHKESLQKGSDSCKKSKLASSSSSSYQPSTPLPPSAQSSLSKTTGATTTSPHQQQPPPAAASNTHSTRYSQPNNNLILDLYSIRPNSQPTHTNNVCNCTLAIQSERDVGETAEIDPSVIEESILETFQRIDAQHVSNSYEAAEADSKMSIIENPLSESVMESSKTDPKTIPYNKAMADGGSLGKPVTPLSPYVQIGSEMVLLNNRVDELTKQLQSLEHSVASDIRLILTLLQQQFQGQGNHQSSASSVIVEPSASDVDPSEALEHRGPPTVQRSLSIPYSTVIAHRKSPSMELSRSWVGDQHSHMRSSSESHRLHSPLTVDVPRAHSTREESGSGLYKRHPSKEPTPEDHPHLKKTQDSSKSLSDGNVTKITDSAPFRSVSQPVSVLQEGRIQRRDDKEDEDSEEKRKKRDGREIGESKR